MEKVRYRRREPGQELQALLALLIVLLAFLGGGWWLVQHRSAPVQAAGQRHGPNDPVVIEVNGEAIHKSEFEAAVASLPPQVREQLGSEAARKEVAEELVKMKLLEQQARRMGIADDPAISGRMSMMSSNVLASAALQRLIRESGPQTPEQLYERNKDRFEVARVKSILVPYRGSRARPRTGEPLPLEQARAKAKQIVDRLRKGEDFEKIAAMESATPSDLGEVSRGSFLPELDQAIFSTPVGEISGPLQTPIGLHIFLVTARKPRTFQEVRAALVQNAQNYQANAIIEDLRKNAKVNYKRPL